MPACSMKLAPFALKQRSSLGGMPCRMDGELNISASVKIHWLESSDAIFKLGDGSAWLWGFRGGESLENCGGDGTAGGMLAMVEEAEWGRRAFEGASEGKSIRGGRYR